MFNTQVRGVSVASFGVKKNQNSEIRIQNSEIRNQKSFPRDLPFIIQQTRFCRICLSLSDKILTMKLCFAFSLALCLGVAGHAQKGMATLEKMHKKYAGKWYKTFQFTQTTEFYRNDSLRGSATWYETAHFPYDFRIDIGDPQNGNAVIYREDSTYYFQKAQLRRTEAGTNPFTFLLGGMYAVSLDAAKAKLKSQGYDLDKGYATEWNGRRTWVVGAAEKTDTVSKQFWVDAEELYLVRTIEIEDGRRMDARMTGHTKVGNGWSETHVMIYIDNKLLQVEKYADLRGDQTVDDRLFDPRLFGQVHAKGD